MLNIIKNCFFKFGKRRVISLTSYLVLLTVLVVSPYTLSFALDVSIVKKQDASQIEFKGKTFWDYWLEQKSNKLAFKIDPLPKEELAKLLNYNDDLITKVELISEQSNQIELHFHLKDEGIESFAYQMEAPSRLLIDIYRNPEVKVKKKTASKAKKTADRKPASELPIEVTQDPSSEQKQEINIDEISLKGLMDGADPNYERFSLKQYEINKDAIIASKQKIFVNFPFLLAQDNFIEELEKASPEYKISEKNTTENQEARLLLSIFNNKRYAAFLEGYEVFKAKHNDTKYDHILRYMEADAHYWLWKDIGEHASFVAAMSRYKKLLEDYPKSPLYERTRLILAYGNLQKKNYVAALQEFLSIRNDLKDFKFSDEILLSIGDSYLAINKFDKAVESYEIVRSESNNEFNKNKANFKIADVYAKQRLYPETIAHYEKVMKEQPESSTKYPNTLYNLGETHFRLKNYEKSHDYFLNFLKAFPMHKSGAFALHRIGEILDILTLEEEKIKGAFLENTFRFPKTPGAFLSDMRLKMYRAPDMKEKEISMLEQDINEFLNNNYELKELDHYITSYLEEAYFQRDNLNKSWQILQNYYSKNITSPTIPYYRYRMARNITRQIEHSIDSGEPIRALRIYGKNKDLWLKDQDRLDLKYHLGRTFEKTTSFNMATDTYKDLLNNLYAIEGTEEKRRRELFEHIPTKESVMLRLANVSYNSQDFEKAIEYLNLIKDDGLLNQNEIFEKAALTADISIRRGNHDLAEKHLNYLVSSWRSLPEKVATPYKKLAEIYLKNNQIDKAHSIYDRLIYHYEDSQSIHKDTYAKTLENKAEAYLSSGEEAKAVVVLEKLMALGDTDKYLNARYKLGQLYFSQGDVAKAQENWAPLQNFEAGKMWYSLAQEKIKEVEWKGAYDKYIDRLPAATSEGIRR